MSHRYTTIDYGELGHYVTSINGVYEDVEREIAWVLLKLTPDGYCRTSVGNSIVATLHCLHKFEYQYQFNMHARIVCGFQVRTTWFPKTASTSCTNWKHGKFTTKFHSVPSSVHQLFKTLV